MKKRQYTLRDIPDTLDYALRERARREGRSLNATAVRLLATGLGLGEEKACYHDLDTLAGAWIEDTKVDAALRAMDCVDEELSGQA